MKHGHIISGFSKLTKAEKIEYVTKHLENPLEVEQDLKDFWHRDFKTQKLLDEFSENTISNFVFPLGVAPNFLIDGKEYIIPMVIEESSVIAAASNSAKFWANNGGFRTEIISTTKVGHVHFNWTGDIKKLEAQMPVLRKLMEESTETITANMRARGGGILNIELVDKSDELENYYKLRAEFETVDSMGANFINSCLESFAQVLRKFVLEFDGFEGNDKDCRIIMSILSNYTPDCLVKCWVECDIDKFEGIDTEMDAEEFIWKFKQAVEIAKIDSYRATTHNKGVFNGIDAVALATGNDFRAIEACGHTFASRNGKYASLTDIEIKDGKFKYSLLIPLALGTVGGLTTLHPLAKRSLEMLGNPGAKELMKIAASVGLANNYGAVKSLVTKGIQKGHMKMHLMNILNQLSANEQEKKKAIEHFSSHVVSFNAVGLYLDELRK